MASENCVCCHDLDFRDLGNSTQEEQPAMTINLLDLQPRCTYCSLLQKMTSHFAPQIEETYTKPSLCLNLGGNGVVLAETSGVSMEGDQSITSIDRFYFYLQGNVGRLRLMLPRHYNS